MGLHITHYKTENGKTRKAKGAAGKAAGKNGATELNPGAAGGVAAGNKNQRPENPAN